MPMPSPTGDVVSEVTHEPSMTPALRSCVVIHSGVSSEG